MTKKRHTPAERTLYHFTSQIHLPMIQAAGQLRTTESNIGSVTPIRPPYGDHIGPDVVWLLDTADLDGRRHGLQGSSADKTRVRFTVRARATRWVSWPPAQRMHPEWREEFIRDGGGPAAARRWWVSERPIPSTAWLQIDVMGEQ